MVVPILLFLVGLVCLIVGGNWFVDGASNLAHRLKIPDIIVGATVVSIGTTLPEVMVSATSAVSGHGEIAYGNAIGSIICNTALIAALTIAIKPSLVKRKSFILPVTFFFGAAIFYSAIAYATGYFSRTVGIILLCIFVAYVLLIIRQSRKHPEDVASEGEIKEMPVWKMILFLVLGAALIAVGADLLVDNGTKIAAWMGVPESVIALTFVALGTSLPELVTAITSLIKGHSNLSIGNIVGANLFNLVLVSGVSATLSPFKIPESRMIAGMNSSLVVDIPVMLFVMALMCIPALIREKLSRTQGILLLATYAAFVVYQFAL